MGTQVNKLNEDEFVNDEAKFWGSSNCESNINKVETITSSNENNENKAIIKNIIMPDEIEKTSSTSDKSKLDYVPFKFQWKEEDNSPNKEMEVMITGSFLNDWNLFMPMIKNPKSNFYEYQTTLSRDIHYFKFMINNNWKCSNLYPTSKDKSNNINNYIDLREVSEKNNTNTNSSGNRSKREKIYKSIYNKIYEESNEGYDLKYPLIKDLNSTAPKVMINYEKLFCLEYQSNQSKLNGLFFADKIYGNNDPGIYPRNCYNKIMSCPNEKIEHLIGNIGDIFSRKRYIRYSTTERKQDKLLTLIYFKPK